MFNLIDMNKWERKNEFDFFSKSGCNINITAKVNITNLYKFAKMNNIKVYSLLVSTMIKAVNKFPEFKYGVEDGKLGYYDVVHPVFYELMASKNTKTLVSEFSSDILEMVERIEKTKEEYKNVNIYRAQTIPKNSIMISCIPWSNCTSISMELQYGFAFYTPIIIFGKFEKNEVDDIIIPLNIYTNHAVNDGYHVCMLINEFQKIVDELQLIS